MSLAPINLCIGTYDGTVAGLELTADETSALILTTKFASGTHASAVRSVALRGSTLVTGGADEVVRIYDVSRRVEIGTLLHHDGTVGTLKFAHDCGKNLLFSAGADAAICVWRVADWQLMRRLTGHQASVTDVAVHPSALVALSTSTDRSLFMWNLARGKISFSAKTKNCAAIAVDWSPDGSKYSLCAGTNVTLSSVDGRSVHTFPHAKNVLSSVFFNDNSIVTGGEERVVRQWDTRTKDDSIFSFKHDARVVDLSCVDGLLFSADSAGGLKIWDHRKGSDPRIETTIAGNTRLTCMIAAPQQWQSLPFERTSDGLSKHDAAVGNASSQVLAKRKQDTSPQKKVNQPPQQLEGTASQRKRKKRRLRAQNHS